MLNKLKKNNKKGFTLVELIVVLVILAILAALLIPALTGYIDKAREKQIIAQTRQAVMAAQTLADEEYALNPTASSVQSAINANNAAKVLELAELTGKGTIVGTITVDSDGVVTALTFQDTNGKKCAYTNNGSGEAKYDPNAS